MFYELWDVGVGKGLARYQSDAQMAGLIRSLLDHHGSNYADDLDLLVEDEQGGHVQTYAGAALVAWVDRLLGSVATMNGRPRQTEPSRSDTADRGVA